MLIKCIVYVIPGFKTVQINVILGLALSYSVKSNAKMMQFKIYNELYVHKCCAVDIFSEMLPVVKQYWLMPSTIMC